MRSPSGTMEAVTVACIYVLIFTMMRFTQTISLSIMSERGLINVTLTLLEAQIAQPRDSAGTKSHVPRLTKLCLALAHH